MLERVVADQGILLAAIASDVRVTRDAVAEAKGGLRLFLILGGAFGGLGALLVKWIPTLFAGVR